MTKRYDTIIVGQGLAGTTLAWRLIEAGQSVFVVDAESGQGASSVAAGLMTPVTGKRLVCSPSFEEDWKAALAFYRGIEQVLQVDLLSVDPMIRVFDRESDRENYLSRSAEKSFVKSEPWEGKLESDGSAKVGVQISPAGRLNVEQYLSESRSYFKKLNRYRQAKLNFSGDVRFSDNQYKLVNQSVEAGSLVLCQGAVLNERFPKVPNNPAKGELWKVKLETAKIDSVVHRSIWIAPDETDRKRFTVGATYEWRDFDLQPSEKGQAELSQKLAYLLSEDPKVERTLVGIRPTMKDREAVLGQHPDFAGLWVFNGLGSKGTLKAPKLSKTLALAIINDEQIPKEESYARLLPEKSTCHFPLTNIAQDRIADVITEGDVVVDATVGRGFDTTFLSRGVGETGRVVGFDVQQEALEATRQRLAAIGAVNVELYHQGHQDAGQVLGERRVKAAMFNLGFLPRSDRAVKTTRPTTLLALSVIYERLLLGGRMTLLCYRGHEGGPEEYEAVGDWLEKQSSLSVERVASHVAKETSPVLFVATRK